MMITVRAATSDSVNSFASFILFLKRLRTFSERNQTVQDTDGSLCVLSSNFGSQILDRKGRTDGRTSCEFKVAKCDLSDAFCYKIGGCIQKFPDWVITKYTLTTINTRWEATQSVTAPNFTTLTHKIAIQLHLVAESCTICSSRSRRPVRKLLDTLSYNEPHVTFYNNKQHETTYTPVCSTLILKTTQKT
jgi:hypothetical protein